MKEILRTGIVAFFFGICSCRSYDTKKKNSNSSGENNAALAAYLIEGVWQHPDCQKSETDEDQDVVWFLEFLIVNDAHMHSEEEYYADSDCTQRNRDPLRYIGIDIEYQLGKPIEGFDNTFEIDLFLTDGSDVIFNIQRLVTFESNSLRLTSSDRETLPSPGMDETYDTIWKRIE